MSCGDCPVCGGLLGPLDPGQDKHPLCAWSTPEDWRIIDAWVRGPLGREGQLGSE